MAKFKQKVLELAEARTPYLKKVTVIDRLIRLLFLGLLPKKVTPNQITVFRFIPQFNNQLQHLYKIQVL